MLEGEFEGVLRDGIWGVEGALEGAFDSTIRKSVEGTIKGMFEVH